MQISTKMNLK